MGTMKLTTQKYNRENKEEAEFYNATRQRRGRLWH